MPAVATPSTLVADVPALRTYRFAGSMPALMEFALVALAIAALLPLFAQLADGDAGRDRRFADAVFRIEGLPAPLLPDVCASEAARRADAELRDRLCARGVSTFWRLARDRPSSLPTGATGSPLMLAAGAAQARDAFVAPVKAADARLQTLRRQSGGDVRDDADAIAAVEAEVQPYLERFQLSSPAFSAGPRPLACAVRQLTWALRQNAASAGGAANAETLRSNAVLLMAAALDGHPATEALANDVPWPAPADPVMASGGGRALDAAGCDAAFASSLAATASLMSDARHSVTNARKNEAHRALVRTAGWQWAGAMAIGYAMLVWGRRNRSPALGVAVAMALWALAAWAGRAPFPFAGARMFEPGRAEAAFDSAPAPFVIALGVLAALLFLIASRMARSRGTAHTRPHATLGSRVGYPGFVLASGLGWLLLFDLSADGHPGNRYLALYHQGHLWLGMLVFSALAFLRRPLARELGWLLSLAGEALRAVTRRLGVFGAATTLLLVTAAAVVAFGLGLSHMRQLTSELGRIWLIVGAAWFFFLRAGPLTERLAYAGSAGRSSPAARSAARRAGRRTRRRRRSATPVRAPM